MTTSRDITSNNRRGYNERLFEGNGVRVKLHNARFSWFRDQMNERVQSAFDLIEIGCFDGRLLDFCPTPPKRYEGFDAGWEGGLKAAQKKYAFHPSWSFHQARDGSALKGLSTGSFSVCAALETLEHIPP